LICGFLRKSSALTLQKSAEHFSESKLRINRDLLVLYAEKSTVSSFEASELHAAAPVLLYSTASSAAVKSGKLLQLHSFTSGPLQTGFALQELNFFVTIQDKQHER